MWYSEAMATQIFSKDFSVVCVRRFVDRLEEPNHMPSGERLRSVLFHLITLSLEIIQFRFTESVKIDLGLLEMEAVLTEDGEYRVTCEFRKGHPSITKCM